jgi:hypothetical protein
MQLDTKSSSSENKNISISGDVVDSVVIAGDNNTVNQTVVQRITNFFAGDTEQQRARRNRHAMLDLIKNIWIKGVLEKSLYNEVLIELGMEERPGAIDHPWDTQVQMPNQTNRTLPAGTSMIDVFDEMNGAMLILGEPGSGKTTMLLELARDCIMRAEQDDNQPISVIFNLSSWSGPKQSIDDWLVNELNTKYYVSKKIAQSWVLNDDLLLLLDGLDEVKQNNREACVNAINDFRHKHGLTVPIVVCSRIADYDILTTKLNLSGAMLLQPITPEQIDEYFQQAGPELESVHQILKNDEMLQELVKQPLILSIMTLAYQGKQIEAITSKKLDTLEARRKHVFDAYVQQMFVRVARSKNELYIPKQTIYWLAWLAKALIEQGQSIFFLDQMRREWFQTHHQRILVRVLLCGLIGALYALSGIILDPSSWVMGLSSGIVIGVIGEMPQKTTKLFNRRWRKIGQGLILGLYLSLLSLLSIPSVHIWKEVVGSLTWLLIGLFLGGTIEIQDMPTDKLKWSSKSFSRGFILGSALSAVTILGTIYSTGFTFTIFFFLILIFGFLGGLATGLMFGLEKGEIETRTVANQGIRQSLKYMIISGLIGWPIGSIAALAMSGYINNGLFFGLYFVMAFGGYAVISHYSLRFLLFRKGHMPWNYIRFLDYCTDLIFLRRVGGGYIFVHRLLMEHFVAMYKEE